MKLIFYDVTKLIEFLDEGNQFRFWNFLSFQSKSFKYNNTHVFTKEKLCMH